MECAPFVHERRDEHLLEADLPLRSLGEYDGNLRKAVLLLKEGRRDVAASLALHLAERVSDLAWLPGAVLVPMPTAAHRVRLRGVDGAAYLAEVIGTRLGLRVARTLRSRSVGAQRGRSRVARLQAENRFTLRGRVNLDGVGVVLVDDVVTTGATMRQAAELLRSSGAVPVGALALARTL